MSCWVRKSSTRVASSALRSADAPPDIGAVDRKRSAAAVAASDQEVDVRIVAVVMVDRDPFERRPEVVLHLNDERTRVRSEVEPVRLRGRYDRLP